MYIQEKNEQKRKFDLWPSIYHTDTGRYIESLFLWYPFQSTFILHFALFLSFFFLSFISIKPFASRASKRARKREDWKCWTQFCKKWQQLSHLCVCGFSNSLVMCWMTDWLTGVMVGWLVDWLAGWLAGSPLRSHCAHLTACMLINVRPFLPSILPHTVPHYLFYLGS